MKKSTIKVTTGLRGGKLATNHSATALKVKAGLKGGRLAANHSRAIR